MRIAGAATGHADAAARASVPAAPAGQRDEQWATAPGTVRTKPTVVPVEPHAPERSRRSTWSARRCAAEAWPSVGKGPDGAGMAHEPRAASRDEEHGDAELQRAEVGRDRRGLGLGSLQR